MKKLILFAALFIALAACKNKDASVDMTKFPPPVVKEDNEIKVSDAKVLPPPPGDTKAKMSEADADTDPKDNQVADTATKIVKDGSIDFETENLSATRKKILISLKRYGGYVSEDNQSVSGDENRKEYELKIRVPARYFDFLLDSVSSTAAKIDSKNISVTDVTTQFIDVKTRLANKEILEKRYLQLLSKSSKVSDLLEIENKLTDIRSDIESTQGQLNYLSKQVAYSSLDITFYTQQTAQVDAGDGPWFKLKTAIADGWQTLSNLFFTLIASWPIIAILVVIYVLIRRWRKRRKATE